MPSAWSWSEEFLGFAARRKMFVEMLFAVPPNKLNFKEINR